MRPSSCLARVDWTVNAPEKATAWCYSPFLFRRRELATEITHGVWLQSLRSACRGTCAPDRLGRLWTRRTSLSLAGYRRYEDSSWHRCSCPLSAVPAGRCLQSLTFPQSSTRGCGQVLDSHSVEEFASPQKTSVNGQTSTQPHPGNDRPSITDQSLTVCPTVKQKYVSFTSQNAAFVHTCEKNSDRPPRPSHERQVNPV